MILNIYVPNGTASKCRKQKSRELKGKKWVVRVIRQTSGYITDNY